MTALSFNISFKIKCFLYAKVYCKMYTPPSFLLLQIDLARRRGREYENSVFKIKEILPKDPRFQNVCPVVHALFVFVFLFYMYSSTKLVPVVTNNDVTTLCTAWDLQIYPDTFNHDYAYSIISSGNSSDYT